MIVNRDQPARIHPEASVSDDATVTGDVSIGAGSRVMAGARLIAEAGASITIGDSTIVLENAVLRVNAVVHLRSRLAAGATVPIGWIAIGDPARLFPPDQHEEIWQVQEPLDFPGYVYGVDRSAPHPMRDITSAMSRRLAGWG